MRAEGPAANATLSEARSGRPVIRERRGHQRTMPLTTLLAVAVLTVPLTAIAAGAPGVSVSPATAAPGQVVRVDGVNFPGNAGGQILFDAAASGMPKYRTSKAGLFKVSFTVPATASDGLHVVTAEGATSRNGKASSVSVSVSVNLLVAELSATPPSETASPTDPLLPTAAPPTPAPAATSTPEDVQPGFPIRGAFYYPWFPEAWSQQGMNPFTKYHPTLGYYDSSSTSVIQQHVAAMQYAQIDVGISSWWGQGSRTDTRMPTMLAATAGSSFRWAAYYEAEGSGDPSVAALAVDLAYLRDRYGSDPNYLRIGGRFVVFVYASGLDACPMVDRWTEANAGINAYLVLKVFSGYRLCANQPAGWHQYAPARPADTQPGYSYTISPGFDKANESTARLVRDETRWNQNVRDMVVSNAPFQLVTTFNEWGEGSSVESADEFATSSGFGAYLDALHYDGKGDGSSPTSAPSAPASTPPESGDPVLLAAGDVAGCSSSGDEATATLLGRLAGTIITVGDNAYDSGTPTEFSSCFGASWGPYKARIRPGIGNHEYLTAGAAGYFGYYGAAAGDPTTGYYAFDLGNWRIYAVNSNCSKVGGCGVGSPQETWLRTDLATNPRACVLAYWHHPRFSSGQHGSYIAYQPLWQDLYDAGAEIVVNGHDHDYERFAPQDPAGTADAARGIREFVVGTGGKNHYGFAGTFIANSEVHNDDTFGVLKLALHPGGYDWQFVPEAGRSFVDSGNGTCH